MWTGLYFCVYSVPDPVRNLNANCTRNRVTLTWDVTFASDEDQVRVRYRAGSNAWSSEYTVCRSERRFEMGNLCPGIPHVFQVWVTNGRKNSDPVSISVDLGE